MQKYTVKITKKILFTLQNVSFCALDRTDFLGFGRLKKQKVQCFFKRSLILATFPFFTPSLELSGTLSPLLACCSISVIHISV